MNKIRSRSTSLSNSEEYTESDDEEVAYESLDDTEEAEAAIEYDQEVLPEEVQNTSDDEEEPELSIGSEDSDFDIWSNSDSSEDEEK